jgi:hypothetical protein
MNDYNEFKKVYEPIKPIDTSFIEYPQIPQPPLVTYSKMKWNTKTSLNNPHRSFTVSGQQLSFTKTLSLPRRFSVLTNNVTQNSVTERCYTPVNDQVIVMK